MKSILQCLDAVEGDFNTLLALCLIYAMGDNMGEYHLILHSLLLKSISCVIRFCADSSSRVYFVITR